MAAEACPSIYWTLLTVALLATAREAAVCWRSCGVKSLRPAVRTAGSKTARRQFRSRKVHQRVAVLGQGEELLAQGSRMHDGTAGDPGPGLYQGCFNARPSRDLIRYFSFHT